MFIMTMEGLNLTTGREKRIADNGGWRLGLRGKCLNLLIPDTKN